MEPEFGVWKRQWHFDHVLLRGREKVEGEVSLAALTLNIMRLLSVKGKKWIEKALKGSLKKGFGSETLHGPGYYIIQSVRKLIVRQPHQGSCAA